MRDIRYQIAVNRQPDNALSEEAAEIELCVHVDGSRDAARQRVEHLAEQCLLASEVAVHQPVVDSRPFGDVTHRHGGRPALGEELRRRPEQGGAHLLTAVRLQRKRQDLGRLLFLHESSLV